MENSIDWATLGWGLLAFGGAVVIIILTSKK